MKNFHKLNQLFALSILSILALTLTNCGSSTNAGGGGSSSVTITNDNTVAVGVNLTLTAEITPAQTTPTFTWTIQSGTAATISGNILTGVAAGTATIQVAASSANGTITATQEITVTTPVTGITISSSGQILVGENIELAATVWPTTAVQTVIFSITDAGTTGASLAGNVLSTANAGTVTVTATATDGSNITAT